MQTKKRQSEQFDRETKRKDGKMLTSDVNDESDRRIRDRWVKICEELGIEEVDMNTSWENYCAARNDYTLDVRTHTHFSVFLLSKIQSANIEISFVFFF